MKENLISLLINLINITKQRNSEQGIKSYELFLEKLTFAKTPAEVIPIASNLITTIRGIDAHGIYFPDEWEVAKQILELCELSIKIQS